MTKYLICFPSRAMEVADDEWEQVGRDAHAVADDAKVAASASSAVGSTRTSIRSW